MIGWLKKVTDWFKKPRVQPAPHKDETVRAIPLEPTPTVVARQPRATLVHRTRKALGADRRTFASIRHSLWFQRMVGDQLKVMIGKRPPGQPEVN